MTREITQTTQGQRMLNDIRKANQRRVDIDDIIALEVLSGVGHVPYAKALMQIVEGNPKGYLGIEPIDISEQLARTLYHLEIGDIIDSNPNSLNATNLYRIKNILTPTQVHSFLEVPDEEKLSCPEKISSDDYVLGRDTEYDELTLFSLVKSNIDGIWGLPNYYQSLGHESEEDKVYLPEIGDTVSLTDDKKEPHFVEVKNAVSGPTLIHRLF